MTHFYDGASWLISVMANNLFEDYLLAFQRTAMDNLFIYRVFITSASPSAMLKLIKPSLTMLGEETTDNYWSLLPPDCREHGHFTPPLNTTMVEFGVFQVRCIFPGNSIK